MCILKGAPYSSLRKWKRNEKDVAKKTLLGDNTGDGTVMLRPFKFQFVHKYVPVIDHIALWMQQCDNPKFAIWS